jgi:cytochrome c oxidase subunit 2
VEVGFGEFQITVLAAYLLVTAALVAVFALVARQARRNVAFEQVTETGYRLRRIWLAFLAVLLTSGVVLALFFLPYPGSAQGTATVKVSGGLFYWSMNPETVPAGSEVSFEVTSVDVNHGFGVYDPDGVLIGNVQAMPGYTNQMDLTLEDPGTYMIACLEYCGFKHHDMLKEFEVTP